MTLDAEELQQSVTVYKSHWGLCDKCRWNKSGSFRCYGCEEGEMLQEVEHGRTE